jgi:hypothetical protein
MAEMLGAVSSCTVTNDDGSLLHCVVIILLKWKCIMDLSLSPVNAVCALASSDAADHIAVSRPLPPSLIPDRIMHKKEDFFSLKSGCPPP